MSLSVFKRALSGLLISGVVLNGHAGPVQIAPLRINLTAASKVAVLNVRNTGAEETVMQVTLNRWTLVDQRDTYARSQELFVAPSTFRLAPGAEQAVHVGLIGPQPAEKEAAYRLLVAEIPLPTIPVMTRARFVVRHDLPVFVAPKLAESPALDVAVECTADGAQLRLINIGNLHVQLHRVLLEGISERGVLGHWNSFEYLLPDARKSWSLDRTAPKTAGTRFLATMLTDHGAFTADVESLCP